MAHTARTVCSLDATETARRFNLAPMNITIVIGQGVVFDPARQLSEPLFLMAYAM